jgi:glycosyltransferase involved in cell wall biosynthesis
MRASSVPSEVFALPSGRPRRIPKNLFLFGWPSHYGGADTKFAHLLRLLHRAFRITVVPNWPQQLRQRAWTRFLDRLKVRYTTLDRLPSRLDGVGLALCNGAFFDLGIHRQARSRGLRVVWSSEMMWYHAGELDAIRGGELDRVLYVSDLQRRLLNYEQYGTVSTRLTGNYVDPDAFPYVERRPRPFTIGRLSRADPVKYPEDFPVFYEALDLPDARFRVMAWSDELDAKYRWHHFGPRWTRLRPEAEDTLTFLSRLDLFVYPLGHRFLESWGRSTVEAMLTGLVPLVPPGHHLENLVRHGEAGFVCDDFREYQRYAQLLYGDDRLRRRMGRNCRRHAVRHLCNRAEHLRTWCEALDV